MQSDILKSSIEITPRVIQYVDDTYWILVSNCYAAYLSITCSLVWSKNRVEGIYKTDVVLILLT